MIQEFSRGTPEKNIKASPKVMNSVRNRKTILESPNSNQAMVDEYLLKESPSKQKYIPSRYGVNDVLQSGQTLSKNTVLSSLQQQMEMIDDEMSRMTPEKIHNRLKEMKSYHPPSKPFKMTEFKSKPIRKSESEMLMFKEIFVAPKEKILEGLKGKDKAILDIFEKDAIRKYEKIIGVEKNEKNVNKTPDTKLKRDNKNYFSTPKLAEKEVFSNTLEVPGTRQSNDDTRKLNAIYRSHDKLRVAQSPEGEEKEQEPEQKKDHPNERVFFEQQIQVQPPETPNYSTASAITPGNGWAPSIPLMKMVDPAKSNVKDLLVRAKAGMQAGDVQKEAHLSFYLGMIHETKKEFRQAISAYRKFLNCAQNMEDKIGVALAMNRLGVNYYNMGKPEKSVSFHAKNLELSDRENSFAAYYNLGIGYRSMKNYDEALKYFRAAYDWACEFRDVESECLATGQLGVTYMDVSSYDSAMESFKDCHDLSVKLNNTKLQLDCLLNMSKISRAKDNKNGDSKTWAIYERAYTCAKGLGEQQTANLCLCNIGVIEGTKKFEEFTKSFNFPDSF